MNYLIRIHDYNKPTEDDELWHVLGNRHWKRLALGHGQLLGVLTSDESAFDVGQPGNWTEGLRSSAPQ